MLALEFPGSDKLIAMINAAVTGDCQRQTTDCIRNGLSELIRKRAMTLPACVLEPVADHYARRELYRCEESGYSVVAMTWGPGQGTPLHDHDAMWCVEGVWQGELIVKGLMDADDMRQARDSGADGIVVSNVQLAG